MSTTIKHAPGTELKFKGYSQPLGKGEVAKFKEGDILVVIGDGDEDDSYNVHVKGKKGPKFTDKVYNDEVLEIVAEGAEQAPAKATKPAPAKKATKPAVQQEAPPEPATGKKQKVKPAKEAPAEPPALIKTKAVTKLLKSHDALEAANILVTQIDENYFTLGGVLSHINREKAYKDVEVDGQKPYDQNEGFALYVEKTLGMKYRKAMYLIEIYEHFTVLGLDETKLSEIGWTKAKELPKVTTAENLDQMIEYAKTHTKEELVTHVQQVKAGTTSPGGGGGGPTATKTRFTFSLFDDKAKLVRKALDEAKKKIDTEDDAGALDFIVTEWLGTLEGSAKVPFGKALKALLSRYDKDADDVRKALEKMDAK